MSLIDNYFGCAETPVWAPNLFDLNTLTVCTSCILRLTSVASGNGLLRIVGQNLQFEESPLTTLSVNGINHNLVSSFLVLPGAHKLGNIQTPYAAEVIFYFQNTKIAKKLISLAIPIEIGEGASNAYFSTLTADIRGDRPTLSTLLTKDTSFVSYDGASLLNRTYSDPRPSSFCDVPTVITYYVSLTAARITYNDFVRIQKIYDKTPGPPKPTTSAMSDRMYKLCTMIRGIHLDTSSGVKKPGDGGGVSTKAMKCVRLDTEKDIVNDTVYINGKNKPGTNLSDELAKAASGIEDDAGIIKKDKESAIQPGDIEKAIGTILGIIIGLVIASTVAVILYKFIYLKYVEQQNLYKGVPSIQSLAMPLPSLPGFFSKS